MFSTIKMAWKLRKVIPPDTPLDVKIVLAITARMSEDRDEEGLRMIGAAVDTAEIVMRASDPGETLRGVVKTANGRPL